MEKVSDMKSSQSLEKAPLGIHGDTTEPTKGQDSMQMMQVELVETAACDIVEQPIGPEET